MDLQYRTGGSSLRAARVPQLAPTWRQSSPQGTSPQLLLYARLLVLAYLALIPWTSLLVPSLHGHDYSRITGSLVASFCAIAIGLHLARPALRHAAVPTSLGVRAWRIAVVTLAAASVVHASVLPKALQEATLFVGLIAVAITIGLIHPQGGQQTWAKTIIAAVLLHSVLTILVLLAGLLNGYPVRISDAGIGYENPRFYNHVQTVALPLTAASACVDGLSKRWVIAAWSGLMAGTALLLQSGGRGTLIGIAAAIVLSAAWLRHNWWVCSRPLIVGMLGGAAAFMLLLILAPGRSGIANTADFAQRVQDASPARVYLWEVAVKNAGEEPWLGIGPMHYANRPNLKAAHPHNIYLQVAAEWGIPMLLLLCSAALVALRRMAHAVRRIEVMNEKRFGSLVLVACLAALLDGAVSGNFVMPVSQMWIAVCAGVAWGWTRSRTVSPAAHSHAFNVRPRWWSAVLVAAAAIQITLLLQDIAVLDTLASRSQAISVSDRFTPRFWFNGWFSK